jgi:hypothetical protein
MAEPDSHRRAATRTGQLQRKPEEQVDHRYRTMQFAESRSTLARRETKRPGGLEPESKAFGGVCLVIACGSFAADLFEEIRGQAVGFSEADLLLLFGVVKAGKVNA